MPKRDPIRQKIMEYYVLENKKLYCKVCRAKFKKLEQQYVCCKAPRTDQLENHLLDETFHTGQFTIEQIRAGYNEYMETNQNNEYKQNEVQNSISSEDENRQLERQSYYNSVYMLISQILSRFVLTNNSDNKIRDKSKLKIENCLLLLQKYSKNSEKQLVRDLELNLCKSQILSRLDPKQELEDQIQEILAFLKNKTTTPIIRQIVKDLRANCLAFDAELLEFTFVFDPEANKEEAKEQELTFDRQIMLDILFK
ncbi:Hypothetical_protein [Hexamita inflata]|uniref:Hypothetical_protein n=1 Tax=Hexamita inflata TaxID=28002 RepID=A0ABP1GGA8_9EUKA